MLILKQSTSIDIRMGPFVDVTDGATPEVGITIGAADQAEVLKANGAATVAMGGTFAAVSGADGWYDYTVAAGDVDTVGEVVFVMQDVSVCLPVYTRAYVVEEAVYDAMYGAASAGPLQATTAGRTLDVLATGEVPIDFDTSIGTLAAGQIEASALDGKGDWNINKTGYSLTQAFPSNFADMSITVTTGLVDITQTAADKVWASASRTLTAFSTALAVSVWDVLAAAVATASSIGLQLKTNVDAVLSNIEADTQNIQSRLPAALVGGAMDADVSAMQAGVVTAAAVATDAIDADALATDAVDEIVDAVWDEVNTVGAHNIQNSTGKQLRDGTAGIIISSGDCPTSGSHTTSAVVLKASENATDDVYNHKRISFSAGTNIGFDAIISDYDGATKICTITPALPAACDNTTDYEITAAIVHTETQRPGYQDGGVWISASGSTTAQLYVDGTVDNPIDDGQMANAKTVADALNLETLHLIPGASIALIATMNNYLFGGHGGTIALGGQDIDNCHFKNAGISGVGTAANEMEFHDCEVGTMSAQKAHYYRCTFDGTVTMTLAGDYRYHDCKSGIAGPGSAVFTKTAGQTITAQWRNWMDSITVSGLEAGDVLTINGRLGTVTLNGADATVEIRGSYKAIVNNLTGAPTVNMDGAWKGSDIADTLTDTADMQPKLGTPSADISADIAALNDISAADVNAQVLDVMNTDTITLPGQEAPPLAPTHRQAISWLYKAFRNRKTQTATTWSLMADDETTVDAKAPVSDDATTAIKQEIVTGP